MSELLSIGSTEPVFVGRARELALLRHWLSEATHGSPRVVFIDGTAGVGKTALADVVTAEVAREGGFVLGGVALEGVEVPYLPMRAALEPLGEPAGFLANGPPAGRGPVVGPVDHASSELLVGLVDAFLGACEREHLVLLRVDDIHHADAASAALLAQLVTSAVARSIHRPCRCLVLVTVRSGPADRLASNPTIGKLARTAEARRLLVRELTELEVHQLLTCLLAGPPTPRLLGSVVAASGGNPLLVRSAVAELRLRPGGAPRGAIDGELTGPIADRPLDIDAAFETRLAGLSEEARQLLVVVALSTAPRRDDLVVASGWDAGLVDERAEEAERAQLLRVGDGRLELVHPQLRQLLLSSVPASERRRLHLAIADRLAGAPGFSPDDEIEHLLEAGPACPADRLAIVAWPAAEAAFVKGAWSSAARYGEAAIRSDAGTAGQGLAERHLLVATARFREHDPVGSVEHFRHVLELVEEAPDLALRSRAALGIGRATLTQGPMPLGQVQRLPEVEELLDAARGRAPRIEAAALGLLAEADFMASDTAQGLARLEEATAIALRDADDELVATVSVSAGLHHLARLELTAAGEQFERSLRHARRLHGTWQQTWGAARLPMVLFQRGQLLAAEEAAVRATGLAEHAHDWAEGSLAWALRATIAVGQGQFAEAEEAAQLAVSFMQRSSYGATAALAFPALAASRVYRGDLVGAHMALDDLDASTGVPATRYRILVDLIAGRVTEAAELLPTASWVKGLPEEPSIFTVSAATAAVEAGVALDDDEMLERGAAHLEAARRLGVAWCLDWPTSLRRLLALAGRGADTGATADAALPSWERARLLVASGDATTADLADAAELLDTLKAAPIAECARAALDARGRGFGTGEPETAPPLRTIMMTDIVGSTATNVRLGDAVYVEVLRVHNDLVRAALRAHGGIELKQTGDGFNAWFQHATDALRCALAVQDALGRWNREHPELALRVRTGVAAGRPIPAEADLFGVAMSMVARVCSLADAGQVLVASSAREQVTDPGFRFRRYGSHTLRGFDEAVVIYECLRPARPRSRPG